jgi:hypothetical protein
LPRLRPRREEVIRPQIEEAICTATFRPGAVALMIERGQRLPIDHEAVKRFPEYFMGLVSLTLGEVTDNGE